MKVLIINGSHRKGNTDLATKKVNDFLCRKVDKVRELILRNIEIKLPDGCEVCAGSGNCPNIKDQFSQKVEPTLRDYDVYVLATPTWSDNVTPLTKIFWDRIVSWCAEDRMYFKGKKLAVITHGMAGKDSWNIVVNWVKSVCKWAGCEFAGSLTFKSGGKIGDLKLSNKEIKDFTQKLIN